MSFKEHIRFLGRAPDEELEQDLAEEAEEAEEEAEEEANKPKAGPPPKPPKPPIPLKPEDVVNASLTQEEEELKNKIVARIKEKIGRGSSISIDGRFRSNAKSIFGQEVSEETIIASIEDILDRYYNGEYFSDEDLYDYEEE